MCYDTLRRIYLRNGVKFRNVKTVKLVAAENKDSLEEQRFLFAVTLANLLREGKHITYLDETTFKSWSTQKKDWSHADIPVTHYMNTRYFGATLYGAIGHALEKPVFLIKEKGNIPSFHEFLEKLTQSLKPRLIGEDKPYLLMDNLSVHTNSDSVKLAEKHFNLLFCTPYSCEFNSIGKFKVTEVIK